MDIADNSGSVNPDFDEEAVDGESSCASDLPGPSMKYFEPASQLDEREQVQKSALYTA